ncbi:hypothetical protein GCM10020358_47650 [Amorphoplanes nipponensis]|uniref:Ig-like domain-containing protein n=1 Tax=Actinoplanes nipponensis TaxID=135950 RepID=A0A919JME6_9ACTN|nr:hypothetical protein [Actinoplanes nipponensis]GIE49464.1 hypothetical protein Ani05nite_29980 [Actinoplanes nipponensis]
MTQPHQGATTRASSIAAAEAPESDFIDAPPPAEIPEWPPVGAYPGEPGHPAPAAEPDADDTVSFAAVPPAGSSAAETEVLEGDVVWHQPPPTGPFRARHEKPGEWHTEPPEHLALEHSPPAEVQPGVQQDQPTEAIPLSMLPHPWEVPFDPHGTETEVLGPPVRHKRPYWVVAGLVLTLLVFGGGAVSAFLLLRNAESGKGAPDPATAVNRFMTAVYTQQDPRTAAEVVCREARDEDKLRARVDQVKGYANEYDAPAFRWNDPAVSGQTGERATVGVQLTMTTDDEKMAQQQLTFTVIRKTGWLVCDVNG